MDRLEIIEEAIDTVRKIDGVSKKQAERIVDWFLKTDSKDSAKVITMLKKMITDISHCEICGYFTQQTLCQICLDPDRENQLMIIENHNNLEKFENNRFFKGKYFIFPYSLDQESVSNEEIDRKINKLVEYAKDFDEVILAISPTLAGEITMEILKRVFIKNEINYSQLAIGLPIGSSVDYMDHITLKQALKNRTN
ncbi:recombination protein RecR [Mycoplasmopsis pullorum]|uniref:toprim domain-containing protein n=1 Tax=Mycoplasmopsis pullorum TaxID=48003 RepID=UPI00111962F2|nr:toprim domain-containing protein [Mycoplasmopsis pullorum]TNK82567.1 recombination protein RecR [Mycoplasmopsis pullorum]TNK84798.1 recombination protein RecR [Mycoplasmopsis pullorum]TNK85492.1 recombination protein RecR [Mycoplasmopsis pullorum]TNK85873.1 recombination protein RecR [Mycoplasmopsis pullorum]TNK87189.1 recombination protein RecR [Mycoplasmopsis pullorum]